MRRVARALVIHRRHMRPGVEWKNMGGGEKGLKGAVPLTSGVGDGKNQGAIGEGLEDVAALTVVIARAAPLAHNGALPRADPGVVNPRLNRKAARG